jgi:hypothetical protein
VAGGDARPVGNKEHFQRDETGVRRAKMARFAPFFVLFGAVFLSWLLIQLRGGNVKFIKSDSGCFAVVFLVLIGLIAGWLINNATGDYSILVMVVLAVVLALTVEVSRVF